MDIDSGHQRPGAARWFAVGVGAALAWSVPGCKSPLPADYTAQVERQPLPASQDPVLAVGDVLDVWYFGSSAGEGAYELDVGDSVHLDVRLNVPGDVYRLGGGDLIEVVVAPGAPESSYRLAVGDTVRVRIPNQPDLSGEIEILTDGRGSFPVIGPVGLRGLTVEEAAALLTERYAEHIEAQAVSVEVVPSARAEIRQRLTILPDGRATLPLVGAVMVRDRTPEEVAVDLGTRYAPFIERADVDVMVITPGLTRVDSDATILPDGRVTLPLLGAVPLKGLTVEMATAELERRYVAQFPRAKVDLLVTGSSARVNEFLSILRESPRGPVREAVITGEGIVDLPLVAPVVAVGRPLTEVREEIRAGYAGEMPSIRVDVLLVRRQVQQITVLGEVARSGVYDAIGPIPALQALAMAGGPTDRAWLVQVLLIQPDPAGNLGVSVLNVRDALRMEDTTALAARVRPNDLLYVPKSPIADVNVWVEQYVRRNLPLQAGVGAGYTLNGN